MNKRILVPILIVLLLVAPLSGCIDLFGSKPFIGQWKRSDTLEEVNIRSDGTGTVIGPTESYTFTWVDDDKQKNTLIFVINTESTKVMRYYVVDDNKNIMVLYESGTTPWAYYKLILA